MYSATRNSPTGRSSSCSRSGSWISSASSSPTAKAWSRRSEERRVGKECRYRCDWSSDVCSSDLPCDTQLTHGQKLKLLEEWELDLKRKLESDGEGMVQSAEGQEAMLETRRTNDAALLGQVTTWLRRAREEDMGEY